MTSLMRMAGMAALAVVLVVGTVLSASALTSRGQDSTADAGSAIPGGTATDRNAPAPEPWEQPSVEAVEPQPEPGPGPDNGILIQEPGVPRDLIASWVDEAVVVSWLGPVSGRTSHYTVTRTHWDEGPKVESFTVDASSTRFIDDNVQAGVGYTYTVVSHGDGLASPPAVVMATRTEPVFQPERSLAQEALTPRIFNPDAGYSINTIYGATAEISLPDYLATVTGEVTFSLKGCDGSSGDYYDSVTVEDGKLVVEANTRGHVHGQSTKTATRCTVTGSNGTDSKDQEFSLYIVSDRTPPPLPPGALSLVEARSDGVDVRVTTGGPSLGYVRLGWRKPGEPPTFATAQGVTGDTILTIPGLEAETEYEVRAYLMSTQAFHLYGNSSSAPASKWVGNLAGGGLGKGEAITLRTEAAPPPPPSPTPEPTPLPTPVGAIRPPPTQEPDQELDTDTDNDGFDTPETDNDGIDTPTPTPDTSTSDTPTPSPDTPTPDTPTPDTPTPDAPTPDTPTPDTPTPDAPTTDTPTPDTPTPDTPTPDTPTPDTPTPDTPTPDAPTPDTPTPDTPTPDTPTPDTPTPDTPTPDTPTPDTPTPDTPTPDTPTPDTPTPDTPTPDTPTPDTPTPDTPTPDTPTPDTPTPDTPTPDTPTPDTPDTPESGADTDSDANS